MSIVAIAALSGGETDKDILEESVRLLKALKLQRLIVIHVVESWRLPASPDTPEGKAMLNSLRLKALEVLEAASEVLSSRGVEAIVVAREGRPCSEIIDFAEKAKASIVIVGASSSRGREQISNTTLCIISKFSGSVLVVKKS